MLLDDAKVPPLDVTPYEGSERLIPVAAEMDVHNLDATENVERYITGEEKISLMAPTYEFSNLSQSL